MVLLRRVLLLDDCKRRRLGSGLVDYGEAILEALFLLLIVGV
jgi:hypothetical protein